jgi:predicted dehydrogenase
MSSKLELGIIGCGSWVQLAHLPAIKDDSLTNIVACADTSEPVGRAVQSRYGIPKFYTDYKEMIARENPDIVLVAIPHRFHASASKFALESGSAVVVEKPMATTLNEAIELAELSRAKGKLLVVGHELRLNRSIRTARQMVSRGALGNRYFSKALHLRRRGIPSGPTFLKRELAGGGAVFDIGSHSIDAMLFMQDFPKPRSVYGKVRSVFASRMDMRSDYPSEAAGFKEASEVEDFGTGLIEFEDSSSLYLETSWASYISEDKHDFTLLGDAGGLHIEEDSVRFVSSAATQFFMSNILLAGHPWQNLTAEYKEYWRLIKKALRNGEDIAPEPLCTAGQGVYGMSIMEAIYRSSDRGSIQEISLPESVSPEYSTES